MKLEIQIGEGFHTWNLKSSIEIETDNYPELSGLSPEQVVQYVTRYGHEMKASDGTEPSSYSLFDELMEQETLVSKEKNYETVVHLSSELK